MGAFSIIGALFHIGALTLLLLGTVTSPVSQSLSLAVDGDYLFGVFGYCNTAKGTCSKAAASYAVSSLSKKSNYIFDDDKRDSLAKILIIFPVACGLTFFSFIVALANINKKTRSSSMALSIVSIILAVLAFIAAALACIFTFLVFYPNIKWCTWIQIGSAILNLVALVFMIINLKLSGSTDDITSLDDGANNEFSFKNNLIDDAEDKNRTNVTAVGGGFTMPPASRFNNSNFKSPFTVNSSDESSSITERKSINDITTQQNRYASSNSALTTGSGQQNSQPNLYAGPAGSSTRNQAPNVLPQTAETQREPTLPQIGNPYLSTQESLPNTVRDDRNILRAGTGEYIDPHLDDNNSLEADSDFTSVSQRAINPKYYRGANNLPPPQQQGAQTMPIQQYPPGPQQYQQAPPLAYGPPQGQRQQFAPPPQQYMMQQNPYSQHQYQTPQAPQQFRPHHGRRASKPNASDIILNNNPDFMVGQARKNMTRYGAATQVAPAPGLGANYKNRGARNQLPPASMTKDSPYGSFI